MIVGKVKVFVHTDGHVDADGTTIALDDALKVTNKMLSIAYRLTILFSQPKWKHIIVNTCLRLFMLFTIATLSLILFALVSAKVKFFSASAI